MGCGAQHSIISQAAEKRHLCCSWIIYGNHIINLGHTNIVAQDFLFWPMFEKFQILYSLTDLDVEKKRITFIVCLGESFWEALWIAVSVRYQAYEVLCKHLQRRDPNGADGGSSFTSLYHNPIWSLELSSPWIQCLKPFSHLFILSIPKYSYFELLYCLNYYFLVYLSLSFPSSLYNSKLSLCFVQRRIELKLMYIRFVYCMFSLQILKLWMVFVAETAEERRKWI